jgi:methionyl-tRNA formyltransferase
MARRAPDIALVFAYGRILPRAVLDAPRLGCVNLHVSLLPKYRGAAPIQWAILHGERQTGISLMQMVEELDAGPVYSRHALSIGPDETADQLGRRASELAAGIVVEDLPRVVAGELRAEPQDPNDASFAPPLEAVHGLIDWNRRAQAIHDQVRGLARRPGAYTTLRGKRLRVLSTRLSDADRPLAPGEIELAGGSVLVGTGARNLELVAAQLEGKKELSARELVNGRALAAGDVLGAAEPHDEGRDQDRR